MKNIQTKVIWSNQNDFTKILPIRSPLRMRVFLIYKIIKEMQMQMQDFIDCV